MSAPLFAVSNNRFVLLALPISCSSQPQTPFFTPKEVGAGTGLGLSITSGSIKEHQGTIQVDNRADEGARFLIQLPLIPSSLKR